MSNRRPTASMSSTSSPSVFTPSSTTFDFGEQRALPPSIGSESRSRTIRVSPAPSSTTSGTPHFTPSPTPFTFGEERALTPSFSFGDDYDPDRPLPSVGRHVSSTSSRQSTPSTTLYTPSTSTLANSTRQAPDQDVVLQQIGDIRNLMLTSPQTPGSSASQPRTSTPSYHVTASAPPSELSHPRTGSTDRIINGVSALRIEHLQVDSPGPSGLRESRSRSLSRRRRSGSGVPRERHQIESEDPPEALFHMPAVQEALANSRTLTSRMASVLSSANVHSEPGSSINGLHRQATRLNGRQLPSSRSVGLVGDSGVGKSSLINSLLDKIDLARAVSER